MTSFYGKRIIIAIRRNHETCNYYVRASTKEQKVDLQLSVLKNICDEKRTIYIDLHFLFFYSAIILDEKYSIDGLHLLGDGYLVWKSVIENAFTTVIIGVIFLVPN